MIWYIYFSMFISIPKECLHASWWSSSIQLVQHDPLFHIVPSPDLVQTLVMYSIVCLKISGKTPKLHGLSMLIIIFPHQTTVPFVFGQAPLRIDNGSGPLAPPAPPLPGGVLVPGGLGENSSTFLRGNYPPSTNLDRINPNCQWLVNCSELSRWSWFRRVEIAGGIWKKRWYGIGPIGAFF